MAFPTFVFFFGGGGGGECLWEVVKLRNALTMNFMDIRKEMLRVQIEWKMQNIKKMQIEVYLCP